MFIVLNDKSEAIKMARSLTKDHEGLRVYETLTGRTLITDQVRSDFREIPYMEVNLRAIREFGVESMEEVPMEDRMFI